MIARRPLILMAHYLTEYTRLAERVEMGGNVVCIPPDTAGVLLLGAVEWLGARGGGSGEGHGGQRAACRRPQEQIAGLSAARLATVQELCDQTAGLPDSHRSCRSD